MTPEIFAPGIVSTKADESALEISSSGNYIILNFGNNIYAFYGHLKPGSILVKKGDQFNMGSLGYIVKSPELTFFFPENILVFQKEIDFLAEQCKSCDFAIIEVTPGTENIYAAYIIEKLKPKMVIPYDRSGRVETYDEFKKEIS